MRWVDRSLGFVSNPEKQFFRDSETPAEPLVLFARTARQEPRPPVLRQSLGSIGTYCQGRCPDGYEPPAVNSGEVVLGLVRHHGEACDILRSVTALGDD